jgi:hypothetical protein
LFFSFFFGRFDFEMMASPNTPPALPPRSPEEHDVDEDGVDVEDDHAWQSPTPERLAEPSCPPLGVSDVPRLEYLSDAQAITDLSEGLLACLDPAFQSCQTRLDNALYVLF